MWFVYVQGHGIHEYDKDDSDEMQQCVKDYLESHQPDAITVIEGKDITSEVINDIALGNLPATEQ